MCPHYIVDEDQFGVGLGEWCELIDELVCIMCLTGTDTMQDPDDSEDIPY